MEEHKSITTPAVVVMEEHKSITHWLVSNVVLLSSWQGNHGYYTLLAKNIFKNFKNFKSRAIVIVMILLHSWIGGNGFSTLMMPKLQITRGALRYSIIA
jgi:hypothetical protein